MSCHNAHSPKLSSAAHIDSSPGSAESLPFIPEAFNRFVDETLRQRAEQYLGPGKAATSKAAEVLDARRLLQELEIHQIELEMQNRELQQARDEAEEAREMYRDLYDFAPVGYFTLSREADVLMANLTGAALLGVERDSLTGCSFSQWIIPNKREAFEKFLAQVFTGKDPVPIEVEVLKVGGKVFFADIEVRKGATDRVCRMMVTDVTRRKAEQKAERLSKISSRSNRKLQAEVHHWREVEASLKTAREELSESLEKSEGDQKQLLKLSQALLLAQEEERKRISRGLNDRIVQALTAIQHELELLTF